MSRLIMAGSEPKGTETLGMLLFYGSITILAVLLVIQLGGVVCLAWIAGVMFCLSQNA